MMFLVFSCLNISFHICILFLEIEILSILLPQFLDFIDFHCLKRLSKACWSTCRASIRIAWSQRQVEFNIISCHRNVHIRKVVQLKITLFLPRLTHSNRRNVINSFLVWFPYCLRNTVFRILVRERIVVRYVKRHVAILGFFIVCNLKLDCLCQALFDFEISGRRRYFHWMAGWCWVEFQFNQLLA